MRRVGFRGWTLTACLFALGFILAACSSNADKLEKLGYSEAEIQKIKESDYVNGIIQNKIQYNDFDAIKKHKAFKADNLVGYTSVFNKIYTKEELDLAIIGINTLKENAQDYEKILKEENEKLRSAIDEYLLPKITLKATELNATSTDKGLDYVKSIISAYSYFDGEIAGAAELQGSFASNKLGDHTVTVVSQDSKGYRSEQDVKFKVVDLEKPVIQIPDTNNVLFEGDQIDLMKDVIGTDNYDGDLTDRIVLDKEDFTTDKEGTYSVTYKLKDNSNNEAEVSRELKVLPILKVNDTFDLQKYQLTLKSFEYDRTDSEPADYFYRYYTASEGNTFLITRLAIKNLDNIKRRPIEIFGNDEQKLKVELIYDGNYIYDDVAHSLNNNWYDTFRSVDPLATVTANLTFELPISVKDSNKSIVLKFSPYTDSDEAVYLRIR